MKFAVESWDPSYGSAIDELVEETTEEVDLFVEVPPDRWGPLDCDGAAPAGSVAFVDGVRRIDARVWITDDEEVRPGVCATVAAGVVRCADRSAEVTALEVRHGVYATAAGAGPIVTSHATYDLVPCTGDSPEDLYLGVHRRMTALEAEVSATVSDCELVVFDGPLRGRERPDGVGYVKTQHVRYLPEDRQDVLGQLGDGQRSPVFLIGGRFTRYSWYLRLPGPRVHPLSGVVRCELPGLGPAAEAVVRAAGTCVTLCRFASAPHRESRAPQNLTPIAGLEARLRARLGDPLLLERGLRRAAALGSG